MVESIRPLSERCPLLEVLPVDCEVRHLHISVWFSLSCPECFFRGWKGEPGLVSPCRSASQWLELLPEFHHLLHLGLVITRSTLHIVLPCKLLLLKHLLIVEQFLVLPIEQDTYFALVAVIGNTLVLLFLHFLKDCLVIVTFLLHLNDQAGGHVGIASVVWFWSSETSWIHETRLALHLGPVATDGRSLIVLEGWHRSWISEIHRGRENKVSKLLTAVGIARIVPPLFLRPQVAQVVMIVFINEFVDTIISGLVPLILFVHVFVELGRRILTHALELILFLGL